MNVAQKTISYYDSKDFKGNYLDQLHENYQNNEATIVNRIIDLFNVSNYETQKYLTNWLNIDRDQAKKIYTFIDENFEDFTTSFNGCYVGYTSLESVQFGEQEEQLDFTNHKTNKPYKLSYLKKIFDKEGFYINDRNYAYYNLDKGLHVDLLRASKLLNDFLLTL